MACLDRTVRPDIRDRGLDDTRERGLCEAADGGLRDWLLAGRVDIFQVPTFLAAGGSLKIPFRPCHVGRHVITFVSLTIAYMSHD